MKKQSSFHRRARRAALFLTSTVVLSLAQSVQAAKPQPPPPENGSLEVLVTGDLLSQWDHTGAEDGVSYDICRDASFSGGGAEQLVLRKLRLDLTTIHEAVPACVQPGPPYRGLLVIRFPDRTATDGDPVAVTYNFAGTSITENTEITYHLEMPGMISAGQWPPPDGTTLEIIVTGWTRLYAGAKEKNACKEGDGITEHPFATDVVISISRDDGFHENDECDCPFDYPDGLECLE